MVVRHCLKCRIEIVWRTNFGRNSFNAQSLTRALQFLPIDDDPAGNVDQESDLDHVGDNLERQFHLFTGQALGTKRYAGHISSWSRLACNQAEVDGVGEKGANYRN